MAHFWYSDNASNVALTYGKCKVNEKHYRFTHKSDRPESRPNIVDDDLIYVGEGKQITPMGVIPFIPDNTDDDKSFLYHFWYSEHAATHDEKAPDQLVYGMCKIDGERHKFTNKSTELSRPVFGRDLTIDDLEYLGKGEQISPIAPLAPHLPRFVTENNPVSYHFWYAGHIAHQLDMPLAYSQQRYGIAEIDGIKAQFTHASKTDKPPYVGESKVYHQAAQYIGLGTIDTEIQIYDTRSKPKKDEVIETKPPQQGDADLLATFAAHYKDRIKVIDTLNIILFAAQMSIPALSFILSAPFSWEAIVLWLVAVLITMHTLMFRKVALVMPNAVRWHTKKGKTKAMTIEEFERNELRDKRLAFLLSTAFMYAGIFSIPLG